MTSARMAIAALACALATSPAAARAACTGKLGAEEWRSTRFSDRWALCERFGSPAPRTGEAKLEITLSEDYVDGERRHVLVVARRPLTDGEVDTCHACAAPSDVYLYAFRGGAWRLVQGRRDVDPGASHGNPSRPWIVRLGPSHRGLAFQGGGTFQGITGLTTRIHALPPVAGGDALRLVIPELHSEVGGCMSLLGACEDVERKFRTVPGADPEWFDIVVHVTLTSGEEVTVPEGADGTDALVHRPLETSERTVRYVHRDGEYVEQRAP